MGSLRLVPTFHHGAESDQVLLSKRWLCTGTCLVLSVFVWRNASQSYANSRNLIKSPKRRCVFLRTRCTGIYGAEIIELSKHECACWRWKLELCLAQVSLVTIGLRKRSMKDTASKNCGTTGWLVGRSVKLINQINIELSWRQDTRFTNGIKLYNTKEVGELPLFMTFMVSAFLKEYNCN